MLLSQNRLGEVVYVDILMPVAGEVTAVNGDLDGTPTLLNASCYENGWLIRVKPEDMAAVDALLSADALQGHAVKYSSYLAIDP